MLWWWRAGGIVQRVLLRQGQQVLRGRGNQRVWNVLQLDQARLLLANERPELVL